VVCLRNKPQAVLQSLGVFEDSSISANALKVIPFPTLPFIFFHLPHKVLSLCHAFHRF
jgi:hypothetical protein